MKTFTVWLAFFRGRNFARRCRLSLFCGLVFVLLSGCTWFSSGLESTSGDGTFSREDASGLDIVTDVPIPDGAIFDKERSLVLGRGEHWAGRLVFRLNRKIGSVVALYQSEMPQFGWRSLSVVQDDSGILQYSRGDRLVTVTISNSGLRGVRISILMVPREGTVLSPLNVQGSPRSGSSTSVGGVK